MNQKLALVATLLATSLTAQSTILETAAADGRFQTLVTALNKSTAIEALRGAGPFTVFAPTDDAFAKVPEATLASLLKKKNQQSLDNVLAYHVVAGDYRAADVVARTGLDMLNGQRLNVRKHGKTVRVGDAKIVLTDIACANGVIHVIDSVLLPESRSLAKIANTRYFSTLIAATKAAGLYDTLADEGPFTILAPTDEAFGKLPKDTLASLLQPANKAQLQRILKYHVIAGRVPAAKAIAAGKAETLAGAAVNFEIDGGELRVQGAAVTRTDINAGNGTVHVIDSVLIPPAPAKPAGRLVIGIRTNEPSAALAAQLHIDPKQALVVSSVTKGGGADKAGLRRYDVIAKVAGRAATSKSIASAKQDVGYGGQVELEVIRSGKRLRLPVTVGVDKH